MQDQEGNIIHITDQVYILTKQVANVEDVDVVVKHLLSQGQIMTRAKTLWPEAMVNPN